MKNNTKIYIRIRGDPRQNRFSGCKTTQIFPSESGANPGRTGSLAAKQHKHLHQNQGRSQAEQVLWLQNNTNIYIRVRGDPRQNRFSGCKTTQIFTSEPGAIPGRTGSLAAKQHKYLHQNQGRSQAEQVLWLQNNTNIYIRTRGDPRQNRFSGCKTTQIFTSESGAIPGRTGSLAAKHKYLHQNQGRSQAEQVLWLQNNTNIYIRIRGDPRQNRFSGCKTQIFTSESGAIPGRTGSLAAKQHKYLHQSQGRSQAEQVLWLQNNTNIYIRIRGDPRQNRFSGCKTQIFTSESGAIPGRTGSLAAKQYKYLHQNQGQSQAEQVLWLQNNTNIYIRVRGNPRQNRFSGCKITQIFTSESGAIPGRTGSLDAKQYKYLHQSQGRTQAEQVLWLQNNTNIYIRIRGDPRQNRFSGCKTTQTFTSESGAIPGRTGSLDAKQYKYLHQSQGRTQAEQVLWLQNNTNIYIRTRGDPRQNRFSGCKTTQIFTSESGTIPGRTGSLAAKHKYLHQSQGRSQAEQVLWLQNNTNIYIRIRDDPRQNRFSGCKTQIFTSESGAIPGRTGSLAAKQYKYLHQNQGQSQAEQVLWLQNNTNIYIRVRGNPRQNRFSGCKITQIFTSESGAIPGRTGSLDAKQYKYLHQSQGRTQAEQVLWLQNNTNIYIRIRGDPRQNRFSGCKTTQTFTSESGAIPGRTGSLDAKQYKYLHQSQGRTQAEQVLWLQNNTNIYIRTRGDPRQNRFSGCKTTQIFTSESGTIPGRTGSLAAKHKYLHQSQGRSQAEQVLWLQNNTNIYIRIRDDPRQNRFSGCKTQIFTSESGAIPGRTGSLAAKQHKYLHQNQGRSQAEQVLWLQNNTNIYIRIRDDPRQNRFSGCKTQIFTSESGAIPGRTGSLAAKHKYLHQNQGRSQAEQVLWL